MYCRGPVVHPILHNCLKNGEIKVPWRSYLDWMIPVEPAPGPQMIFEEPRSLLCTFLNWVIHLFITELHEFFIYFGYQSLVRCVHHRHILSVCELSFCFLNVFQSRCFKFWLSPTFIFSLMLYAFCVLRNYYLLWWCSKN